MSLSCRNPKKNSRRTPKKLKFSIQKKAMAQKKKMKKLAKTTGAAKKSRRKDPGIPNSFPLKGVILQEIALAKETRQREKEEKRLKHRAERVAALNNGVTADSGMAGNLGGNTSSGLNASNINSGEGGMRGEPSKREPSRNGSALGGGTEQENFDFEEMTTAVTAATNCSNDRKFGGSVEDIAMAAAQRKNVFEQAQEINMDNEGRTPGDAAGSSTTKSSGSFFKELNRIIQLADVVLEVLDARDPNGCRCPKTERFILSQGKRIVFVLNKIDLVPAEVVRQWLAYLRRVAPTVAFKSLITPGGLSGARAKIMKDDPLHAKTSKLESNTKIFGAETLVNLLKNYSRIPSSGEAPSSKSVKGSLTVGIIGYPNVGKSSIINSLKRNASAVKVGGEAGVTRCLQEVHLDEKLKLIDSPGVVFSGNETSDPSNILRNAVKVSSISDPVAVVDAIVARSPADVLIRLFKIPAFSTTNEFIAHVARARGRLSKGGRPDSDAAARAILTEWTSGKLRHYCMPPTDPEDLTSYDQAKVLSSFDPELDIEALWNKNDEELRTVAALKPTEQTGDVPMTSSHISYDAASVARSIDERSIPTGDMIVTEAASKRKTKENISEENSQLPKKRRRALLVEQLERKQQRQKPGQTDGDARSGKRRGSEKGQPTPSGLTVMDCSPDF